MSDAFSEPVSLVGPDPEWSGQYAAEAALIERELTAFEPVIDHIGSTAVPLRAKPIIDIQVAVREPDVSPAVDALRALAYEHHGQGGVRGREYLVKRPAQGPDFNVHVFAAGNPLLNDNRMIRDYLREHPTAAREYEQYKAPRGRARPRGPALVLARERRACCRGERSRVCLARRTQQSG